MDGDCGRGMSRADSYLQGQIRALQRANSALEEKHEELARTVTELRADVEMKDVGCGCSCDCQDHRRERKR